MRKRVAIMQPYFAPYIGYISLIKHSDLFILFDTVQFIRHGWIERNRMLKQNESWLYIQVPLQKYTQQTLIKDIVINDSTDWKSKILAQLIIYKKRAPYYKDVLSILEDIFSKDYKSIVQLNKELLLSICSYLGIKVNDLPIFSEMNMSIDDAKAPDEWALNICKNIDGDILYINPIGGLDFFDRKKYERENIQIAFQKMELSNYSQRREQFEAGLSILDVMMFNSPEEVNNMLDKFQLI